MWVGVAQGIFVSMMTVVVVQRGRCYIAPNGCSVGSWEGGGQGTTAVFIQPNRKDKIHKEQEGCQEHKKELVKNV